MCGAVASAACGNSGDGKVADKCGATPDKCALSVKTNCLTAGTAAVSQGRVYTPSLAQACIDQTNKIYGQATINKADLDAWNDACQRVYAGKLNKNDMCQSNDYLCSGSLICDKGHCADKAIVNNGDQCGNAGQICPLSQYCTSQSGLMLCVDRKTGGAVCAADAECAADFHCAGAVGTGASADAGADAGPTTGSLTCVASAQAGGACASDSECASTAPLCPASVGKCLAVISFAAGAPICKDYGG
jgi:hypothetical protein